MARVGRSRLGGNIVSIDHGNGYLTKYMHLDGVNVKDGQQVGPDDVIGLLGMSGRATGPNLHYQILKNGRPVNPEDYWRR